MAVKITKRTRLENGGFDFVRKQLQHIIPTAVLQTAILIKEDAKARAPKDTEFLAESMYVSTIEDSGYAEAKINAEQRSKAAKEAGITPKGVRIGPNADYTMLPEIRPDVKNVAYVVVGAKHGYFGEYGSTFRPAKAFLLPAVNNNRATLTNQIKLAYNGLSVKGVVSTRSTTRE